MINIRIAEKKDVASLVEFNAAMALETENKTLDRDILTTAVTAVFDDPNKGFYVVAENEEGSVVGGLMITFEWSDWRNAWFWWIQSVYIVSEARGQGIYSQLYDHVKEMALQNGTVIGFRLYVELENHHAQAVYEKLGMARSNYYMYDQKI